MNVTKSTRYCLAVMLLLLSPISWASCSVAAPDSSSIALNGSITVARDKAQGTAIGNSYGYYSGTAVPATCTSKTAYFFLKFASPMTASSVADAYKTNVDGIGVKVWSDAGGPTAYVSNNGTFWLSSTDNGATYSNNVAISGLQLKLYVTGAVAKGTGTVTLPVIEGWINDSQSMVGAVKFGQLALNSSITVTARACTTPDVSVTLGKHMTTEFSGIGSTSSSTSFNLQLNNCAANLSSVSYSFAPVTSLISSPAQYVTLDGSSVATGVGIQLLNANDALVPFNTKTTFNGYTSAGSSYTIPLKARYIQTATTMKPGAANSSVVFTMSYE